MATRRAHWADAQGQDQMAAFDHGAPAFSARTQAFRRVVEQAQAEGGLVPWTPASPPDGVPHAAATTQWVAVPDMPELCRRWLGALPVHLAATVDALRRDADGWHVESQGQVLGAPFSHVVLAMPPAQAAVLLAAYRPDWAARASQVPMQPCWVLMGVAGAGLRALEWEAAWPRSGHLASLVRNETKPGRARPAGLINWVVQASTAWSLDHLEDHPDAVQAALQAAVAEYVGEPVRWQHSAVHRWRYAFAPAIGAAADLCWWDAALGLGVCGDFLGGAGVEGAWRSAQALADRIDPFGQPHEPAVSTAPAAASALK